MLAVQQHGSDHDGAKAAGLGDAVDFGENPGQQAQVFVVIVEPFAVPPGTIPLAPVAVGVNVVIDGVPVRRRRHRQRNGLRLKLWHPLAAVAIESGFSHHQPLGATSPMYIPLSAETMKLRVAPMIFASAISMFLPPAMMLMALSWAFPELRLEYVVQSAPVFNLRVGEAPLAPVPVIVVPESPTVAVPLGAKFYGNFSPVRDRAQTGILPESVESNRSATWDILRS